MSPSVSARLLLTQSDARLVAFARAGHERAFEALVRRYRGPLLGYCRRLLLSEERAEDALQQALMQAWLALRAGTEVQNAKAWLYRIVHNSALNALRVSGYDYCTLSESLSGADAPQEDLDRRIAVREALAGLAALPEMQREALLRTAVEGSSHREAARELGLSEPALRGLVYRARATLRATAGAFVPGPIVSWALGAGSGTPMGERVAEVGVGGGAGVAGLLMKGGAMAVTAGVLAGSLAAVHVHRKPTSVHRASASAHRQARAGERPIAPTRSQTAGLRQMADVQVLSSAPRVSATHRSARRVRRAMARQRGDRRLVGLVGAGAQTPLAPHGGGGDRGGAGDGGGGGGGGTHDRPRNPGASAAGGGGDAKGGDGGGLHATNGDGPGNGEGGASGDGGQGGALDGGHADGGGASGEQREQGIEAAGDGRSRDGGGTSGTPASPAVTTTNASPESEQTQAEGGKKD